MLDYQDPLRAAEPGIDVEAAVSRQWSDGLQLLESLKAQGQLGREVIVGLGTNGPISDADVDTMMAVLTGASRVSLVNVHVNTPWQDPDNAVLARGAGRYPERGRGGLGRPSPPKPPMVRGRRDAPRHRRTRRRRPWPRW